MICKVTLAAAGAALATVCAGHAQQPQTVQWSCSAQAPDACYFHLCHGVGAVAIFVIGAGRSTRISGGSETIPGRDTYCVGINRMPATCRCKTVSTTDNG